MNLAEEVQLFRRSCSDLWPSTKGLWCLPRQVSEERGHAQELLAKVLVVEQQLVLRLVLRLGLWRVPLEELLQLAVLLLVAAGSAD